MTTEEVELGVEAKARIEDYLRQVRASLVGCRTVDAGEVERDVREHIETALHDVTPPVRAADVEAVLRRLGSPHQWVPVEELPWWRRVLLRFRTGTDDQRLIYLSFGMLVAGLCIPVFLPALLVASFFTARTALAMCGGPEGARAYRWMLYPQLLMVYAVPTFLVMAWPVIATCVMVEDKRRILSGRLGIGEEGMLFHAFVLGLAVTGVWWVKLAMLSLAARRAVRVAYYPFLEGWGMRGAVWLIACGGLLMVPVALDGTARELARAIWEYRFFVTR